MIPKNAKGTHKLTKGQPKNEDERTQMSVRVPSEASSGRVSVFDAKKLPA